MLVQIPSTADAIDDRGHIYKVTSTVPFRLQMYMSLRLCRTCPLPPRTCTSAKVSVVHPFLTCQQYVNVRVIHLLTCLVSSSELQCHGVQLPGQPAAASVSLCLSVQITLSLQSQPQLQPLAPGLASSSLQLSSSCQPSPAVQSSDGWQTNNGCC